MRVLYTWDNKKLICIASNNFNERHWYYPALFVIRCHQYYENCSLVNSLMSPPSHRMKYVRYTIATFLTGFYFTSKGGDPMIIDFDERKFRSEIKSIAKSYGAKSSDAERVASMALSAVIKASKPVNS